MSDYIKRTDLIDAVEELLKSPYANDNSENILLRQFSCGVRDALKLVRDMAKDEVPDSMKIPSADVRENMHGEWIKHSIFWTCSECKNDIRATTDGIDNFDKDPIFCPYCGADNER